MLANGLIQLFSNFLLFFSLDIHITKCKPEQQSGILNKNWYLKGLNVAERYFILYLSCLISIHPTYRYLLIKNLYSYTDDSIPFVRDELHFKGRESFFRLTRRFNTNEKRVVQFDILQKDKLSLSVL